MSPSLFLTAWLAATPSPAKADAFTTWLDERVRAESARVVSHERLDLDGDGRSDHVVCFVFNLEVGTTSPVILVGLATGERFALSGGGGGLGRLDSCPSPSKPSKRGGSTLPTLHLTRSGLTGYSDSVSLRFDRLGPLLAASSLGDRYMSMSADLQRQEREYLDQSEVYQGTTDTPDRYASAALVSASSKAWALPPVRTWVSWGQGRHQGERDAALQVTASHTKKVITVQLRITDDTDVRATSGTDKAVLAADHLELWWQEGSHPHMRTVQLGVARDARGQPLSVWFQAPEPLHALPAVRWSADNQVEVDLRTEWLFPASQADKEREGRPFTVVFSDSDGKGQETLVSTTDRRPTSTNFGGLFLAAEKQRLPRLSQYTQGWSVVKPDATLRDLVSE